MTAPDLFSCDTALVKAELLDTFSSLVDSLLQSDPTRAWTPREVEEEVWSVLQAVGADLLSALFAALARRRTQEAVEAAGLTLPQIRLRLETDYWAKLQTTLGPVRFPWFAFRDPAGRTHVPARDDFPLYRRARVSDVLLEWEALLAADHPFRKAATALHFFTHGATDVEDTTLERHAVLVGQSLPREWLYLEPDAIRAILRERATRDTETGRPFVYVSTDAHALRLFTDETWEAAWKMVNGIRLWCRDAQTGETIHLGGEFTTQAHQDVIRRLHALHASGHLPFDGNYGEGVQAQVCVPTDGLDWIGAQVVPLYPGALASLDPYHVVQQVAETAGACLPKSRRAAVIASARRALGMREKRERKRYRKGPRRTRHRERRSGRAGSGEVLLRVVVQPLAGEVKRGKKRYKRLVAFVKRNLPRMRYGELRRRGASIGSGAMESIHRTGSQTRLKRAGCRWRPHVAQAILNLRMLALSGRWTHYWRQPALMDHIAKSAA